MSSEMDKDLILLSSSKSIRSGKTKTEPNSMNVVH